MEADKSASGSHGKGRDLVPSSTCPENKTDTDRDGLKEEGLAETLHDTSPAVARISGGSQQFTVQHQQKSDSCRTPDGAVPAADTIAVHFDGTNRDFASRELRKNPPQPQPQPHGALVEAHHNRQLARTVEEMIEAEIIGKEKPQNQASRQVAAALPRPRRDMTQPEGLVQPPSLRRAPNVQQAVEPGAYAGAPGERFNRNHKIRFSLVGVVERDATEQLPFADNQVQSERETPTSPTSSILNMGLVEAREVAEESIIALQPAQQVDLTELAAEVEDKAKKQQQRRRIWLSLIACFILILTVGLGLGLGLSTQRDKARASPSPTVLVSPEPSEIPSTAPTQELDLLLTALPDHTQENIQKGSTPQYKAWQWLIEHHQNIHNFTVDWRGRQLFALATFFYAFEGENWNRLIRTRWMDVTTINNECFWFSGGFGRFVDGEYREWSEQIDGIPQFAPCNNLGEFTHLELQDLQLSGFAPSIPPELALLSSLGTLLLYQNDVKMNLTEMLPKELYQITSLRGMEFYGNHLYGSLPSELALFTGMEYLDLESNSLSGTLPSELGLLTSLMMLLIFENALSGLLPTELGLLTSLTRLELDVNQLSGSLPSELVLLTNLTTLTLFENSLTGLLSSEMGLLTNLRQLELGINQLSGSLPSELALLTDLIWLTLFENSLTGLLPCEMGLLTSLIQVELGVNQLSGSLPSELVLLTNLTVLTLFENSLTGLLPSELGFLANIVSLDLHNNSFFGSIPKSFSILTSIGFLDIKGNPRLSGTIPNNLCYLQNASCKFMDMRGQANNCSLRFDCTNILCGCDCPCSAGDT